MISPDPVGKAPLAVGRRPRSVAPASAAATARAVAVAVAVALLAAGPAAARSDTLKVTLSVPMPPKMDMTGLRRVLVTQLIIDEESRDFSLNRELVNALRRDLKAKAGLDVVEADPPALPEQPIRELLANTGFWHRLAETYHADLVISGEASFKTADRSGYVQADEISPTTGQRIRRTRFVEREAFILDLRLFFLRGDSGALAWEDHFSGDQTYDGQGYDRLAGTFDLYDRMWDDIRSIVTPGHRQVQRTLFSE